MARPFWRTTAEAVLSAVEAVGVSLRPPDSAFVADFCDMRQPAAEAALGLAVDLGLLSQIGPHYKPIGPLPTLLRTSNVAHKAAVLRVVLDTYEPFVFFRERLLATGQANQAAEQTRVGLDLDSHRDDIRDTLVSLGGYAQSLASLGGGRYAPPEEPVGSYLSAIAEACTDDAAAQLAVRERLGADLVAVVSYDDVIVPLGKALLKAGQRDPRAAVVEAGNAVESYLAEWAHRVGVNVANDHGINAKVVALASAHQIPAKLVSASKYLGHLRNAADHGIDPDVAAAWNVQDSTGIEYPFVALSFLVSCRQKELGGPPII